MVLIISFQIAHHREIWYFEAFASPVRLINTYLREHMNEWNHIRGISNVDEKKLFVFTIISNVLFDLIFFLLFQMNGIEWLFHLHKSMQW